MVDAAAAHDLEYWVFLTSLALASLNVLAKLTPSNGPWVKPLTTRGGVMPTMS
jgi:hypothetical protein